MGHFPFVNFNNFNLIGHFPFLAFFSLLDFFPFVGHFPCSHTKIVHF